MRRSAGEKMEIINIVQGSEIGVKRTLEELDINRSTFYNWYNDYKNYGYEGLKPKASTRNKFWNKIPNSERQKVVEIALEIPEYSPREIATHITDTQGWFISESSVYRILKDRGLITSPAYIVMTAADEFKDKTSRIHEQWQTDFTYFKIIGWGWYYLVTVMDDYSRYIIHWELCKNMESADAERAVRKAIEIAGLRKNERPRLLSDNGSCFISNEFKAFTKAELNDHVRGAPYHPQTQGKIERYHRTMKNVVKLNNYYFPEDLNGELKAFVVFYNTKRYHESLKNVTPADVYFNKAQGIYKKREKLKQLTIIKRRKQYLKEKYEWVDY